MAFYIVVDNATGIIDNRIALDDPEQWEVPAGHSIVEETAEPMAIGGSYIDGIYAPPPEPPPLPLPEPPPPAPEDVVLYDHENRIRGLEGQPLLSLEDFAGSRK